MMRKGLLIGSLCVIFLGIAFLFWRNEWIYNLPTPVPNNYRAVDPGTVVDLPVRLISGSKPLFIHFFNPDCPCSRFNIRHFKDLVGRYGDRVDFVIVVLSSKGYKEKEVQSKFDLRIPVLFDSAIAVHCGVYSTPQAVLLDANRKLYYRGNYNRSRYCTDVNSNYAQLALEGLLSNKKDLRFDKVALTAYGCRLPNCKK
jgi:hypothetical protein